ncbi:MAG: twin-arginine translocation signal domain-containing protein, partial [Candidatus Aminicenantes bacterium]|nr:twin-arginine translocation signal domain-containing protein [Candidatus Aminicenantes bacterium]
MKKRTRRDFFKLAGMGVAAASLHSLAQVPCASPNSRTGTSQKNLDLGMASYTFREFSLDDTLAMTRRL